MKFKIVHQLSVIAFCMASGVSMAADVREGAALFKKNHYNEAAVELLSALPTAGSMQGMANLTLGMNYQHSARLHAALQRESVDIQVKYLKSVLQAKGKLRAKYAGLYYAEALIEKGSYKKAKKYLKRISRSKSVGSKNRLLAKVNIGLVDYLSNRKTSAKKTWAAISSKDPEVLSELAAAYSRVGYKTKTAEKIIDKAIKTKSPSSRLLSNALSAYADLGRVEDGLKVAQHDGLNASAGNESVGKNKEITYFDTHLMAGLSKLYNKASMHYLTLAEKDAKFATLASYYQAEAHYLNGDLKGATRFADQYIAGGKPTFMEKALRLKDVIAYRMGNKSVFTKTKVVGKAVADSELLLACARVKADCKVSLAAMETQLLKLQGRNARVVNNAIGEYYLRHGKADLAVSFLEEARDKAQKNNIAANDPVMLVSIAEAYAKNKLYSESLEIYFEMSKEFPAVRQIQDATQGIYSTEQKSAGDVKIF